MKHSFVSDSDPSLNSTVVLLKNGACLEVRRGAATGKAIADPKTWASLKEWRATLPSGDVNHQPAPATAPAPAPAPAVEEEDILTKLIRLVDVANSAPLGSSEKYNRVEDLSNYMLTPPVLEFIRGPQYTRLRTVIVTTIQTLIPSSILRPSLREKMERLVHEYAHPPPSLAIKEESVVPPPSVPAAATPVAPMPAKEYCAAFGTMAKNMRVVIARTDIHKEVLPFYKLELLAFVGREDVVAFRKTDHAERLDTRAYIRWLISKDTPTATVEIAQQLLDRIPM